MLTTKAPLVATLFHYGAFRDTDVMQVSLALGGYGVGLLGLVAIKVLAPGFYADQDMRTPVRIAVVVLVITCFYGIHVAREWRRAEGIGAAAVIPQPAMTQTTQDATEAAQRAEAAAQRSEQGAKETAEEREGIAKRLLEAGLRQPDDANTGLAAQVPPPMPEVCDEDMSRPECAPFRAP